MKQPSTRSANLLYLATMVAIVTIGARLQHWSFGWGLIATEVALVLAPTILFLRLARLPVRETLRLRWPGWRPAILSLVIGAGFWPLSIALDQVSALLLGYVPPTPPGYWPTTPAQALLLATGLVIAAPVCEEALFRGYIQRAYQRDGQRRGFLLVSLLFALYHLRFQGLPALLPIALVLGYLAWRSDSLVPSVLAHLAHNGLACLVMVTKALGWSAPTTSLPVAGLGLALAGPPLALVALWQFRRCTTAPTPPPPPEPARRLSHGWPLLAAGAIYLAMAGLELATYGPPSLLPAPPLQLQAAPWQAPVHYTYRIRNTVGDLVGTATCAVTPDERGFTLTTEVHQDAFEARQGRSYWKSGWVKHRLTAHWLRDGLHLTTAEASQEGEFDRIEFAVAPSAEGLAFTVSEDGSTWPDLPLPADALLITEWPWRLSALPFAPGYRARVTLAWPRLWQPERERNEPAAQETTLQVVTSTPITTPAGRFVAWQVTLGNGQTAWYDVKPPHALLQHDDGFVVLQLESME